MSEESLTVATGAERSAAVNDYIMQKIADSDKWSLPFIKYVYLPDFISLHQLMLVFCGLFLFLFFVVLYRKNDRVPSGLTNALEVLVIFIRDEVCIACLGDKDGRKLAPLFLTFFFFILGLNLMGLVPLFANATGNISVTAGLALITLFFMIFGSIYYNGIGGFAKAFMPHGVPWPVLIMLVPIEFIGLFIKAFALTIRLFANMMAGSIVIYALIGLVVVFGAAAFPSILLAVAIFFLKILVAFLQAYIFTMLSAMFIGQTLHPEH